MMKQVKISLLAVDESHCISQWGASFRPEYLKIARFAEEMDVERVLCLTATATRSVADDICDSFYIDKDKGVFRTPVYRHKYVLPLPSWLRKAHIFGSLALRVEVADTLEQKLAKVIPLLQKRAGPAIIYVTLQKQAEQVAEKLRDRNLAVDVYHAGLPAEKREEVQLRFMQSEKGIVCATIAFGMGIDKGECPFRARQSYLR